MAGRPRKAGKRTKNGRLKRDSRMNDGEKPNAMAARETVALRRCRDLGKGKAGKGGRWIATSAEQLEAIQPVYGTVEGRLHKAGKLSRQQYDAAVVYAEIDQQHRLIVGLPQVTARAVDIFAVGGQESNPFDVNEKSVAWIKAKHDDLTRALQDRLAQFAVAYVVLHQHEAPEDMLPALARGLDAVHNVMVDDRKGRQG